MRRKDVSNPFKCRFGTRCRTLDLKFGNCSPLILFQSQLCWVSQRKAASSCVRDFLTGDKGTLNTSITLVSSLLRMKLQCRSLHQLFHVLTSCRTQLLIRFAEQDRRENLQKVLDMETEEFEFGLQKKGEKNMSEKLFC